MLVPFGSVPEVVGSGLPEVERRLAQDLDIYINVLHSPMPFIEGKTGANLRRLQQPFDFACRSARPPTDAT
jgi:hypothetical protein